MPHDIDFRKITTTGLEGLSAEEARRLIYGDWYPTSEPLIPQLQGWARDRFPVVRNKVGGNAWLGLLIEDKEEAVVLQLVREDLRPFRSALRVVRPLGSFDRDGISDEEIAAVLEAFAASLSAQFSRQGKQRPRAPKI